MIIMKTIEQENNIDQTVYTVLVNLSIEGYPKDFKKYQKLYTMDALGEIFAIFKYSHFGHF